MQANPLLDIVDNLKYKNSEQRMDKLVSDIDAIKADMETIRKNMEILTDTSRELSLNYLRLTSAIEATENILNTLKEQKGTPSNGIS